MYGLPAVSPSPLPRGSSPKPCHHPIPNWKPIPQSQPCPLPWLTLHLSNLTRKLDNPPQFKNLMAGNAQISIRVETDQNAYEKLDEQGVVHLVAGDSFDGG